MAGLTSPIIFFELVNTIDRSEINTPATERAINIFINTPSDSKLNFIKIKFTRYKAINNTILVNNKLSDLYLKKFFIKIIF